MNFLNDILNKIPEYHKLIKACKAKKSCEISGISNIHKTHIMKCLHSDLGCKMLFVTPNEADCQSVVNDLISMGIEACFYPFRDYNFMSTKGQSREYEYIRLNVLSKIIDSNYDIIVLSVKALLQFTMPQKELSKRTLKLKTNDSIDINELRGKFIDFGYVSNEKVEGISQFSIRGGIVDFFSPNASNPVRLEFFSDEIESISYFDVDSQRRSNKIDEVCISACREIIVIDKDKLSEKLTQIANEFGESNLKHNLLKDAEVIKNTGSLDNLDKYIPIVYDESETILSYLDEKTIIINSEYQSIAKEVEKYEISLRQNTKEMLNEGIVVENFTNFLLPFKEYNKKLKNFALYFDTFSTDIQYVDSNDTLAIDAQNLPLWNGSIKLLKQELKSSITGDSKIAVMCGTDRMAKNVYEELIKDKISVSLKVNNKDLQKLKDGTVTITSGVFSSGFYYPLAKTRVISHGHINIDVKKKKNLYEKNKKQIHELSELTVGDYIVHSLYGIGQFKGINKVETQGIIKDYIKILYAKDDVLYVPVTQLDMVSKYIGAKEDAIVKLSRLGSQEWKKTKKKAYDATKEIAKELIKIYAKRMEAKGHAFSPDTDWQKDFEARFEYEETKAQLTCIDEIKEDMMRVNPMDRLLCGDVGYGKTEVALRAAFKCVSDSKQCAILVPTTILAWQHYQTIIKRFEGFPVSIELLSRFRTAKQQKEIISKLKTGDVDIVVGTHRLTQKDIGFRDLGLIVIDEEQRFGVLQKENLKAMAKNVDVLTLTATPIPRTLNMAFSGIRDMSSLEEPPQDRYPVQTYVLEYNKPVINNAIKEEINRGGQVYYLHNRIASIAHVAKRISDDIPEARVGVGHANMSEEQLSKVWKQLIEGEINVLVCTTIIESGIDVPNVNTIIIENADLMGLSQLHQIRGRVGRSTRRSYAYLTFRQNKALTEIAQKRLNAIRDFTQFGSGFKIAKRDLELRGAGNILGGEQHGHMESVGYDMYVKLLSDAIKKEKGEIINEEDIDCVIDIQISAYLPEDYIRSTEERLSIYRKIAAIKDEAAADDIKAELKDRFGYIPKSVYGLIDIALIRNKAAKLSIYEIKQKDYMLLLYLNDMDTKSITNLIRNMGERLIFNAGAKPYISIKTSYKENMLAVLKEVLEAF